MTIGEFIKQKRIAKGLTIEQLSKLCNSNDSAFSRIENNKRDVEFSLLTTLCKVLDFTPNELASVTGFSPSENSPPDTGIKEIIQETARATSEETINRIRENYRTPLFLQQFNELSALVKKGRQMEELEKEDLPPGAIRMKVSTAKLPLVTGVKCGNFTCPTEETYEMISVPEEWIGKGDFVIEVSGDSMKECGICDKMHVLIKKQNICSPGDIVLICDYNETDISKGVLKKARNINDMGMVFINGSGDIIPLNENIRIEGKAVSVKGDL